MLISVETDEVWTFSDMDAYTNRIANYFTRNGFQRGDVVAIFMENKPKYVACMIGLAKIGVTSALINYQLSDEVKVEY
jgi:solute carrier family 27 fatty acid transporter 1/4